MNKLLLKGGTLVSARGTKKADVLISGEKIVAVGKHLAADAQEINVSGKLIFPGFIDAHTHFDLEVSDTVTADDFEAGTKSAIAGGVTTVVDFATQNKGETLTDALNNWHMKAFANSSCDYAFHMAISDWRDDIREELPAMFEQGVTSFKVYMIYDAMELSDRAIYELMTELKQYGGIVGCHCENSGIIGKLREEAIARGDTAPVFHPRTRPDYTEAEAINRFLSIAKAADAPCIVVHLSTKAGYEEILRARQNGVKVYVETCPQYLLLDDSVYRNSFDESAKYICSPPLRKPEDNRALWGGLKAGNIDTVSTDHCSFTLEQKRAGESDFTKIPNGGPGVEHRPALIMTTFEGQLGPMDYLHLLSEGQARVFGMYPRKGALAAGSDADICVWDPSARWTISAANQHQAVDYTTYEGFEAHGRAKLVFVNGTLAVRDGEPTGEKPGSYVAR